MGFQVEDGKGTGVRAGITYENQLITQAEVHQLNHHVSRNTGQVYQIVGREPTIAATTQTVLHLKNTSTTLSMIISYMRLQVVGESGGTALPAAQTYFQIGFGTTYSSGGTAVTPVNVNRTSSNVAGITAYTDTPTVTGTFVEADAWYADGNDMETFSKEGSWILGLNDTMEIRLVSDHTAGIAYARVTALMMDLSRI